MQIEDFQGALRAMHGRLVELEASARKLPNQNFADILKSSHGRLSQLVDHPQLAEVHAQFAADLEAAEKEREAAREKEREAAREKELAEVREKEPPKQFPGV
jgi:hypothetical protein